MVARKKDMRKVETVPYVPTEQEKAILQKQRARLKVQPPVPRLKVSKNGKSRTLGPDHPNAGIGYALLNEALGTVDIEFVLDLLRQLASVATLNGEVDESKLNFLMSVVKNIKPQDHLESMLVAQMGAVHLAAMKLLPQLYNSETLPQQDSAARAFTKLVQIYSAQMETLKRYRTGGEQKVTVQHVSVNEGGQAIVGNVTQNPANVAPPSPSKSTPLLSDGSNTAMPAIGETTREKVPLELKQKNVS